MIKIPFEISFPLETLEKSRKIDFENRESREEVLKRSIYYSLFDKEKNPILERRSGLYYSLSREVLDLIKRKYHSFDVLNLSVFGSALFSENPEDFDFLAITRGNVFLLEETKIDLETILLGGEGKPGRYSVGVSIKGLDNLSQGICNAFSKVSLDYQKQIIYRTASALYRRHIPIIGCDFVNNDGIFVQNIYAQASDLLNNAYELFYLDNKRIQLNDKQRSRKILSRIYETVSYLDFLKREDEIANLRKEIYLSIENGLNFSQSKELFNRVVAVYEDRIKQKKSSYV
jgi:hypothetical protein